MQRPPGNGYPYDPQFVTALQQLRTEVQSALNQHSGFIRKYTEEQLAAVDRRLDDLSKIAQALAVTRSGGDGVDWAPRTDRGIVRVEDVPGRRVPFDLLVDIPIGNNTTSQREQSVTISQEGPFVAVKRIATFMSSLQFEVSSGSTRATFSGRSFGRYRPIHSAWDIFDANGQAGYDASLLFMELLNGGHHVPAPLNDGNIYLGAPPIVSAVSNFRTMEFDARITVVNAGSSYPRQNISVPSSMWSPQINAPSELGALDFFERGEVLTIQVQPNHVNNPPAGNADGHNLFGLAAGSFPFLNGQYDPHEGIASNATNQGGMFIVDNHQGVTDLYGATTDLIQRLPDGILTIGWQGYRIIQPVGPA
jgi:hypothetical protein